MKPVPCLCEPQGAAGLLRGLTLELQVEENTELLLGKE